MSSDLKSVRKDYQSSKLEESNAKLSPWEQLALWLDDAKSDDPLHYNAMNLATIDQSGFPSSRTVLLRSIDDENLIFYTNYNSDKGTDLFGNSKTCINFFWKDLERQIRIKGNASKVSSEISDAYFASRPRESQIGAWTSNQSKAIENRELLESKFKELQEKFEGKDIPRPDFWGGFKIEPVSFEFWQGRAGRLHDRLLYAKNASGDWKISRLEP